MRAVRFQRPERIPYLFWRWGPNDLGKLMLNSPKRTVGPDTEIDEFGSVWKKPAGRTIGYVTRYPLADWRALENYIWPDPDDPARFAHLREEAGEIRAEGKAVFCDYSGMLWERLWHLRGFDNALIDLLDRPEFVLEVVDKLTDFMTRLARNAQEATGGLIDVWCSTDDWGLQSGPFIAPEIFRKIFKPCYERIFRACHSVGMHTYLHSDGRINALLPSLVEAGLDILEIEDIRVLNPAELGIYRGKLAFCCTLDAQSTMPNGDRQAIKAEAAEVVENMAAPDGGLIASIYWDPESCGVSEEMQRYGVQAYMTACEIFRRLHEDE